MSKSKCGCVGVEIGTYKNQQSFLSGTNRLIGIDRCLVFEIVHLWLLGIKTVMSCCGHNKVAGIISVAPEEADKMKELGYKEFETPNRRSSFHPKFLKPENFRTGEGGE